MPMSLVTGRSTVSEPHGSITGRADLILENGLLTGAGNPGQELKTHKGNFPVEGEYKLWFLKS